VHASEGGVVAERLACNEMEVQWRWSRSARFLMCSSSAGGVADRDALVEVRSLEVCKEVQTWSRNKETWRLWMGMKG